MMKDELAKVGVGWQLFFQEKPVKLILALKEMREPTYQTVIAKKIDATYAHTLKILNSLKKLSLIKTEEVGRVKMIGLTDIGEETAEALKVFLKILKLADLAQQIETTYNKEVKGKLREEIKKERVQRECQRIKETLKEYFEDPSKKLALIARRLATKTDQIVSEATGFPAGMPL